MELLTHRYKLLMDRLGYDKTGRFEKEIKATRGVIDQAVRRNSDITPTVADLITTRFPQVSRDWLLTGEGEMFSASGVVGEPLAAYETTKTDTNPTGNWVLQQFSALFSRIGNLSPEDLRRAAETQEHVNTLAKLGHEWKAKYLALKEEFEEYKKNHPDK